MKYKLYNKGLTKLRLLFFTALSPMLLMAQDTPDAAAKKGWLADYLGTWFLALGFIFILAVIAFLYRFLFLLMEEHKRDLYEARGIAYDSPASPEPLFTRLYNWASGMMPVEKEADIMLDHNYDGIRELDNRLPPWWVAMFYITIAIGTVYFLYYHYFDYGLSSREAYAMEMKVAEEAKVRLMEKQANLVNENNVTALTDEAALKSGKKIFLDKCASCHGKLGEGGVGPNLTDDYWLHGGDIKSIFKTIKHGVPQKGMIAWKTQMNPSSIHQVTSYILTLHGTKPANAKEPQGDKYIPQ